MAVWCLFLTLFSLALTSVTSQTPGECLPTATTGCLNGESFEFDTQFACGEHIYNWSTTGCCAQVIPFNTSQSFCCYDGIHDFDQYYCAAWSPSSSPSPSQKPSPRLVSSGSRDLPQGGLWKRVLELGQMIMDVFPIDTRVRVPDPKNQCTHGNKEFGCLNGHRYDWDTETCCANFIIPFNTTGCCDGVRLSSLLVHLATPLCPS